MLSNPLISLRLSTDWKDYRKNLPKDSLVIYTGPIDEFFNYQLGELEWRTVDFEIKRFDVPDYQGAAIINFADENIKFTRSTEFTHFHPERETTGKTILFYESSRRGGGKVDPYYPIATKRNLDLLAAYKKKAQQLPNIFFGGRLGSYQYFDMDDTVANALTLFEDRDFQGKL